MMAKSRVVLALSTIFSVSLASPIQGGGGNALCVLENPILQAFGAQSSASAFCSSFLTIATKTVYATVAVTTYVFT